MGQKLKIWQISLLLLVLLWWVPKAFGGIRPSFSLEDCSWNATHIVVVTETVITTEGPKITPEMQAKIEALIKQLGDDNWSVREEAHNELIKIGIPTVPLLKKALESKDPEIRMRSNIITKRITELSLKIDGVFCIIESWKGDLKKGDVITITQLASFAPEASREISAMWKKKDPKSPTYVTGSKMVLFLKKVIVPLKKKIEEKGNTIKELWMPASSIYKDIKHINVSVTWIEQEKVYAFIQVINPGPSVLISLGISEKAMKTRVLHILKTKDDLEKAKALPDLTKRAEAIQPFTTSNLYWARKTAFDALGNCGEGALPVLRKMLQDKSLSDRHAKVVDAMVKAGGIRVGPELTTLLEQELTFWKEIGPHLPKPWWGRGGIIKHITSECLEDRYGKTLHILYALKGIRFTECKKIVTEFRDFWRSLPQLEDPSGLTQMSEACDNVLQELQK